MCTRPEHAAASRAADNSKAPAMAIAGRMKERAITLSHRIETANSHGFRVAARCYGTLRAKATAQRHHTDPKAQGKFHVGGGGPMITGMPAAAPSACQRAALRSSDTLMSSMA